MGPGFLGERQEFGRRLIGNRVEPQDLNATRYSFMFLECGPCSSCVAVGLLGEGGTFDGHREMGRKG